MTSAPDEQIVTKQKHEHNLTLPCPSILDETTRLKSHHSTISPIKHAKLQHLLLHPQPVLLILFGQWDDLVQ